jgi:hypothetical protein
MLAPIRKRPSFLARKSIRSREAELLLKTRNFRVSSGGTIAAAPSRSLQAEMKPAAGSKLHSDAPETIGLNTLSAPAPLAKTKGIDALSYTGGTVINGGVMAPAAPAPIVANPIIGTGGITKAGGGTITLAGKDTTSAGHWRHLPAKRNNRCNRVIPRNGS